MTDRGMIDLPTAKDTGSTTHDVQFGERVEQLEVKIAYLERANTELSDVVFRQQLALDALGTRLRELSERVESTRSEERPPGLEDERPPHY